MLWANSQLKTSWEHLGKFEYNLGLDDIKMLSYKDRDCGWKRKIKLKAVCTVTPPFGIKKGNYVLYILYIIHIIHSIYNMYITRFIIIYVSYMCIERDP